MSSGYDSNGNFILGLGSGQGNIIEYNDILSLINFYNGKVSLSTPDKSLTIKKSYFTDYLSSLDSVISSGIYSYDINVYINLKNYLNSNNIIYHNMIWPKLELNMVQNIYNLSVGTHTFVVPTGTTNIYINQMVGGGGGGGGGTENSRGGSGGSGGSSAYVSSAYVSVSSGQTVSFIIGAGGNGVLASYDASTQSDATVGGTGGTTSMTIDGNTIFVINGGSGGQSGGHNWGGNYGTMGLKDNSGYTNNGNNGISGTMGTSTKTGSSPTAGVQGASSIYGKGGSGGSPTTGGTASNGGDSISYGAGGGSGANADGKSPYVWSGGKGGDGYGTITMSVPVGWTM